MLIEIRHRKTSLFGISRQCYNREVVLIDTALFMLINLDHSSLL